jgi:hypothetical protein
MAPSHRRPLGEVSFDSVKPLADGRRLDSSIVDQLLRTARGGVLPGAQAAVWALGFGTIAPRRLHRVVLELLDIVADADLPVGVRAQAAEAVGDQLAFTKRSSLRRVASTCLIRQLSSPQPELRFWSAFSLGKLRAKQAKHRLRALITDDARLEGFWSVGEEASDALQRIDGRVPPTRLRPSDAP